MASFRTKLPFRKFKLNSLLFMLPSNIIKGLAVLLRHCADLVGPEHPYQMGSKYATFKENTLRSQFGLFQLSFQNPTKGYKERLRVCRMCFVQLYYNQQWTE